LGCHSNDVKRNKMDVKSNTMKWTVLTMLLMLSFQMMAQRPLNKRDQKAKEEFEAQIAAEEKYEELTAKADDAFKSKDYLLARMTYQEAIPFNTEMEQWLFSKVNDLDILMAKNAARAVDSIYVKVPTKSAQVADLQPKLNVESRTIDAPKPQVTAAEPEPDSIVELVPKALNTVEPKPEPALSPKKELTVKISTTPTPTPKEEKVKEDFSHLNDGITEDTFKLPNHEVLRIIVKEGIDVKVFKRVKHNWGGEFYFLDGMDVTKRYWMEQVDLYRVKYARSDQ